jgi:hypothetical protein
MHERLTRFVRVTGYRTLGHGGLQIVGNPSDCDFVLVEITGVMSARFDMPAQRDQFELLLAALEFGYQVGDFDRTNRVRAALGVAVLDRMPVSGKGGAHG